MQIPEGYNLYHYDPNTALTYVGIVCFAIVASYQLYLLLKFRSYYFIPFVVGCTAETIGYAIRRVGADQPSHLGPFIIQNLLLLLAPIAFSATVYMLLKKIILSANAEAESRVSMRWLTKIFVAADLVCLWIQAGGGGLQAASGSSLLPVLGKYITLVGLAIQIVVFGYFLYLTQDFARKLRVRESAILPTIFNSGQRPALSGYRQCIYAIYVSGALIVLRSLYRLVEYAMGSDGYLMTHEVFFYLLDTLPMFLLTVYMSVCYPPRLIHQHDEAISTAEAAVVRQAGPECYQFSSIGNDSSKAIMPTVLLKHPSQASTESSGSAR